jgi:hypothetical protein
MEDGLTLRELEALFKSNPPRLEDASKSKHSRLPSFYDKHLRENVILKQVKMLPSLQQAIAGVVDRTLSSILQRLPPAKTTENGDFVTETKRYLVDTMKNQPMRNERSVANLYCELLRYGRFDSCSSSVHR